MMRAVGTMLGVHIQYAQQEARGDVSRVVVAALLLLVGAALVGLALLFGQAAVVALIARRTSLGLWRAIAVVAATDAVVGMMLVILGRNRLRKPILKETRLLVKRTAKSLVE